MSRDLTQRVVADVADDSLNLRADRMMDALLRGMEGKALVEAFLMCQGTFAAVDAARKAENARMQEFVKAWQDRRDTLEELIVDAVVTHGEETKTRGNFSLKTMLGTVAALCTDEWDVKLGTTVDEVEAQLADLREVCGTYDANGEPERELTDDEMVEAGLVERVLKLTDKGKGILRQVAVASVQECGAEPTWATVKPPGPRLRVTLSTEMKRPDRVSEEYHRRMQHAVLASARLKNEAHAGGDEGMSEGGEEVTL